MALRVVHIDDDERFRTTARRTLVAEGVDVVAEVADGAEAADAVGYLPKDELSLAAIRRLLEPEA